MNGPEGSSSESEGQVKHSREAQIANAYAELSEGDRDTMAQNRQEVEARALSGEHAEHNRLIIEEGTRKREALHGAREALRQIEAGEVKPENKHEAWEKAMTDVETANADLHSFADSNPVRYDAGPREQGPASGEPGEPVRYRGRHEAPAVTVEEGPAPYGSEEEQREARAVVTMDQRGVQGRKTSELIGKVMMEDGSEGSRIGDQHRAMANEVIARMVADKGFAKELLRKSDLGRDYSDRGISEAMAAAALPYEQRAQRAEAKGQTEKAAILRQEASEVGNFIARSMSIDQLAYAGKEAGVEVSVGIGAGLARVKTPKRPRNALKGLNIAERHGFSLRAFLTRN